MERTRTAAVLSTFGAFAITLLSSPADASTGDEPAGAPGELEVVAAEGVPYGRCDLYRPAGDEPQVSGIDRCVEGVLPDGATIDVEVPAVPVEQCDDGLPVHAGDGVQFHVGGTCDTGRGAAAEPARVAPPPEAAASPAPLVAPPATTAPPPKPAAPPPVVTEPLTSEPVSGGSVARGLDVPTTVVALPASTTRQTPSGDHSGVVMLYALAALSLAALLVREAWEYRADRSFVQRTSSV